MTKETTPKIRKLRKKDLPLLLEIERAAFPKTAYTKEILLYYARQLPDGFILLETGRGVAGYIIFDKTGHIISMAVRPEQRKKGVGRRLFRYAFASAGDILWLEVRTRNSGAIQFYEKMGMKKTKKVLNYYGEDDAFIMVLNKKPE